MPYDKDSNKVLILEDNDKHREGLVEVVTELGLEADAYPYWQGAALAFREGDYRAGILDVQVPRYKDDSRTHKLGYDLAADIIYESDEMPVAMYTSQEVITDKEIGLAVESGRVQHIYVPDKPMHTVPKDQVTAFIMMYVKD